MPPMADTQQILNDKRMRLRKIEAQYLRTKEYLKSSDWNEKRDSVLARLSYILGSYKIGMDGVAAGFVIGQARQAILEIQEVTDIIVQYESLKDELNRYDERNA